MNLQSERSVWMAVIRMNDWPPYSPIDVNRRKCALEAASGMCAKAIGFLEDCDRVYGLPIGPESSEEGRASLRCYRQMSHCLSPG